MPGLEEIYAIEERRYQTDLARSLVGSLGFHGAVDACLRNGWERTLKVLMDNHADSGEPCVLH